MSDDPVDWLDVVRSLAEGDPTAFFRVSQLVTGVLRGMRAYDIEADWSDVIQDVAMGTVEAVREGRLQHSENVAGFVRQVARHKVYDRLRRGERTHTRRTTTLDDAPPAQLAAESATDAAEVLDLRRSLERLPQAQRDLVVAVYGDRKTYEENNWTIAISQAEELGLELFWKRKDDLQATLDTFVETNQVDFACLMITDIGMQSSKLLVSGHPKIVENIDYPREERFLFDLPGVVSRKKQLLPTLMWILNRVNK